ncbi:hypothetical protein Golomagni_01561 [Golovinomyces magnicellulatus]|nr:hypothetical protein Golomagni_01561 [Golovinomyces magnicellulatus]
MSLPAAKRRRRDVANKTLSKPFRSPFKRTLQPAGKSPQESNSVYATPKASLLDPEIAKNSFVCNSQSHLSPLDLNLSSGRKFPSRKAQYSPTKTTAINSDPEVSSLLRIQRDLEKKLKECNELLDTAEQARKIEYEARQRGPGQQIDGELIELIGKWTHASRQAAEELFAKVQDRVNRMGGPRAWKEMEKRRTENFNKWDQDESYNQTNNVSDDEDADSNIEKRDIYAEYSIDPETDIEKSQRVNNNFEELPGEEDVLEFLFLLIYSNLANIFAQDFNMAMMLKTMNIDLEIIGYDRTQQQWID